MYATIDVNSLSTKRDISKQKNDAHLEGATSYVVIDHTLSTRATEIQFAPAYNLSVNDVYQATDISENLQSA